MEMEEEYGANMEHLNNILKMSGINVSSDTNSREAQKSKAVEKEEEIPNEIKNRKIIFNIPRSQKIWPLSDLYSVPCRSVIHGDDAREQLYSLNAGYMYKYVDSGWSHLGLPVANDMQRSVYPQIVAGHDCFITGMPKGGTTLSYLVPICALLLGDIDGWKKLPGKGPVAVIISYNRFNSVKIENHAQVLLTGENMNQLECVVVNDFTAKTNTRLSSGVEMIIITPELFLRKVNKIPWLKLDRLKFFVLDDAHWNARMKKDHVKDIFELYSSVFSTCHSSPQIIVSGTEWNKDIEALFCRMPRKPTVIIGNPKAAIAYGKIRTVVHHVEPEKKAALLSGVLNDEFTSMRIIIVCGSKIECREVENTMIHHITCHLLMCYKIDRRSLTDIRDRWGNSDRNDRLILITFDQALKYLELENADMVIHYNVEDVTNDSNVCRGTVFADRFRGLWNLMRNITQETRTKVTQRKRAVSHIFMTAMESDLDRIVKTFATVGIQIPKSIRVIAHKIKTEKQKSLPLCGSIKLLGRCDMLKMGVCEARHIFTLDELKKDGTLPGSGKVEMRITKCEQVSSYVAQLIRYFPSETGVQSINFSTVLQERTAILKSFYENKENLKPPPRGIKKDILCAIKVNDGAEYTRAKIEKIMTYNYMDFPKHVRLFCVDTGEYVIRKAQEDLFKLPEEFESLPYLTVEAILVGLQPYNNGSEYTDFHLRLARSLIVDKVCLAKIIMSIDNTIWVTSMRPVREGELGQFVRSDLVEKKCASINKFHEHWIWKITCRPENIAEDPYFVFHFQMRKDKYDWAFIETCTPDKPRTDIFSITYIESPHRIFGNVEKFKNLLDDLNDDMQNEIEELIKSKYKNYTEQFINHYLVGLVVLVKEDESWYRAIITERWEGSNMFDEWGELLHKSVYTRFSVFMVDYGETKTNLKSSDLFPILKKFVGRLPFQAIRLSMDHIESGKSNDIDDKDCWNVGSITYLQNRFTGPLVVHEVYIVAFPRISQDANLCKQYSAIMFPVTNASVEVGDDLVMNNLAEFTTDGEQLLDDVMNNLSHNINETKDGSLQQEFNMNDDVWDVFIPATAMLPSERNVANNNIQATTSSMDVDVGRPSYIEEVPDSIAVPENIEDSEKLLYPTTLWGQTRDMIVFTILLPDIKYYTFKVGPKRLLTFRSIEPPLYGFDLKIFGSLYDAEMKLTGLHLQIKLKKRLEGLWPSITRSTNPLHWLKIDLEYSVVPDMTKAEYINVDRDYRDSHSDSGSENSDCSEEESDEMVFEDISWLK